MNRMNMIQIRCVNCGRPMWKEKYDWTNLVCEVCQAVAELRQPREKQEEG